MAEAIECRLLAQGCQLMLRRMSAALWSILVVTTQR
jgi:hypothetical protein